MPAYAITVTCVVAASSVILFLIFYRMKVLDFKTLLSVTLASLISALGLPAIFVIVSAGMKGKYDFASPLTILIVSIVAYLLIVAILSLIISFIINGAGSGRKKQPASENGEDSDKASDADDNYLEQIFVNFIGGQEQKGTDGGTPATAGETELPETVDAAGAAYGNEIAAVKDEGPIWSGDKTAAEVQVEGALEEMKFEDAQEEALLEEAPANVQTGDTPDAVPDDTPDVPTEGGEAAEQFEEAVADVPTGDNETANVQTENNEAAEQFEEAVADIQTEDNEAAAQVEAAEADIGNSREQKPDTGDNTVSQYDLSYEHSNAGSQPFIDILTNIDENAVTMENNLEISVDSNENIDKMGIEKNVHNRSSLTIEDCINEAFRLKGAGDLEGAILHHMYALDKKAGKELTFWIILDICVMYRSLGQQELALDILNSYYETYGDMMDISVKEEIRRNLTAIQA